MHLKNHLKKQLNFYNYINKNNLVVIERLTDWLGEGEGGEGGREELGEASTIFRPRQNWILTVFVLLGFYILFYVCFACVHVCVQHECLMPTEFRRDC